MCFILFIPRYNEKQCYVIFKIDIMFYSYTRGNSLDASRVDSSQLVGILLLFNIVETTQSVWCTVYFDSKSKQVHYCNGQFRLLNPLYHLNSGPKTLRVSRITAAVRTSKQKFLVSHRYSNTSRLRGEPSP